MDVAEGVDGPMADELEALVARARRGDPAAPAELGAFLDGRPDVWRAVGDLAAQAREAWVGQLAGADVLLAESVRRKVADLRAELGGAAPTPIEGLLVERVLACWVEVNYADTLAAQAGGAGAGARQDLLRRQEGAHRRYLAGVKQLAVVRKLLGRVASTRSPVPRLADPG